jgi:hypothetical protein
MERPLTGPGSQETYLDIIPSLDVYIFFYIFRLPREPFAHDVELDQILELLDSLQFSVIFVTIAYFVITNTNFG